MTLTEEVSILSALQRCKGHVDELAKQSRCLGNSDVERAVREDIGVVLWRLEALRQKLQRLRR